MVCFNCRFEHVYTFHLSLFSLGVGTLSVHLSGDDTHTVVVGNKTWLNGGTPFVNKDGKRWSSGRKID